MNEKNLLAIYLVLFFMEFIVSWFLSILNLNNILKNRNDIPALFKGLFSEEKYAATVSYNLEKGKFSLLSGFVSSSFLLIVVLTGFLGHLDTWLSFYFRDGYMYNIVYIFLVSIIFSLVSLPFSLFSQFYIEEFYGFNKMTARTYLSDTAKQLLITPVIAVPMLLGLFFFMDKTGSFWWLYATLFITVLQLIVFILYPLVIAPLFNKFTPLEDGELKERLNSLAHRTGFKTSGIYLMDGSRRSSHSNAYFTGIGRVKRIVLFDTLVESLSVDELESVLAHEIGHYRKKHIVKRLILSVFMMAVGFYVLSLLMNWNTLYRAFGYAEPGYHAILIILSICLSPFSFFLSPLGNGWSRKHEYEADRFAKEACGGGDAMMSALKKLGLDNMSNLTPHSAYSFFHYSHPALSERLAALSDTREDQ